MRKFLWSFCFILGISITLWQINGYRNVKLKIISREILIPLKDKKRLESFFRDLIVYNSVGYTLLGDKPISFECILKPVFKWDLLFLWHTFFPSNLKKYRAWKTWQKYEYLFNKENILIWSEPSPRIENGELIVIANNKQIERVVQENQQDFISLRNLDTKALFKECLRSHDGLLGILLGYGRNNARLFYEKNSALMRPVFSAELDRLFENKKAALNYTFGWPHAEMAEILMYPTFMGDADAEETRKLKLDYLEIRQKILHFYEDKDFLEGTFELLNRQ